jgi:hypothetical protein
MLNKMMLPTITSKALEIRHYPKGVEKANWAV